MRASITLRKADVLLLRKGGHPGKKERKKKTGKRDRRRKQVVCLFGPKLRKKRILGGAITCKVIISAGKAKSPNGHRETSRTPVQGLL